MMASFFLQHDFVQPLLKVLIRSAFAKPGAKVMLGNAEKAGADFSIGRQPQPVAMAAKGLADGRDDAEFATPIGKGPALRSL